MAKKVKIKFIQDHDAGIKAGSVHEVEQRVADKFIDSGHAEEADDDEEEVVVKVGEDSGTADLRTGTPGGQNKKTSKTTGKGVKERDLQGGQKPKRGK